MQHKRKAPNDLGGWVQGLISKLARKETNVDATSRAAKNQLVVPETSRRNFLRSTAALAAAIPAASFALPAEPESDWTSKATLEQEYMRETLEHVCLMVELMRAWHKEHEARLSAFDKKANSQLRDLVVEGVMSARTVARAAGIELPRDYIDNHVWENSAEMGVTA